MITYLLASLLLSTSIESKVGQLLMTSVYPDQQDDELDPYIKKYKPGHLLFVGNGWNAEREKYLIARYQKISDTPLTIAQDLEWGLSQRLVNVPAFPKNPELVQENPELVEAIGFEIARECHILGVNLNLAPVVDVVEGQSFLSHRSFGSDPEIVSKYALAIMGGMRRGGLKTCAKHFPGHGATVQDSHKELPVITATLEQLKARDIIPFQAAINAHVDCVMTSHISLPHIDSASHCASLSYKMTTDVLKNELNFKGIVITDDLMMQAISDHYGYGEAAVKAYEAGNDILLFTAYSEEGPEKVRRALKEAHEALVAAVRSGRISEGELTDRVNKIYRFKQTHFSEQKSGEIENEETRALLRKLTKTN